MKKYTTMPNFNEWTLTDLIAYCQAGDNSNGDWDNVREDEREYLIETATSTWEENQY